MAKAKWVVSKAERTDEVICNIIRRGFDSYMRFFAGFTRSGGTMLYKNGKAYTYLQVEHERRKFFDKVAKRITVSIEKELAKAKKVKN